MAKILVVDDEEHIRLLYSEELTEAGYEIVTADSGLRLMERIEEEKPDLVVLDIKMGTTTAWICCRISGTGSTTFLSFFRLLTTPSRKI